MNSPLKSNLFKRLGNGRPIGRLFLGHGRALRTLDKNDLKNNHTDKQTDRRGANEALIVRLPHLSKGLEGI